MIRTAKGAKNAKNQEEGEATSSKEMEFPLGLIATWFPSSRSWRLFLHHKPDRTANFSTAKRISHRAKPMNRVLIFLLFSTNLGAQLPEGSGREETERLCRNCHELERSVSRRQDRDGWQATINKMVAFGTKGTDQEFALILDYLTQHFPAEEVPPVNVNKAAAIELESRLSLRRSQAAALIAYRTRNGKFKSIEDLKKVPGVDVEKIESKKDRIVF